MSFSNRLHNELARMQRDSSSGKSGLTLTIDEGNNRRWVISFTGAPDSLYAGEVMQLEFLFPQMYPMDPPGVKFIGAIPIHPHVYSNGQICLSILTEGWSPCLNVESVTLSILSMLSSCKEKKRPPDDWFATSAPVRALFSDRMSFVFHDDDV